MNNQLWGQMYEWEAVHAGNFMTENGTENYVDDQYPPESLLDLILKQEILSRRLEHFVIIPLTSA